MKKTKRQLSLGKETIRNLAPVELDRAAGGNGTNACTYPLCPRTYYLCGPDTTICNY